MKKYPIYLFDFDYTLANSEEGILTCFHITFQKLGMPDAADDTIRHTIGLPMDRAVAKITGLAAPEDIEAFIEAYRVEADRYMTDGTRFFPQALPTLRALRAQGAKIAIVSNKTGSRVRERFLRDGATDLVDLFIGSEDVKNPKPHPEGIKRALSALGGRPEQALYTGDSETDAQTAKNAGTDFAGITTGTTDAKALSAYPHVLIAASLEKILPCTNTP